MSRKILLADDSVTIQKVVELTFMDEDVEVVTFGDGSEALERLDDVAPDLVVADVHMPGADGYEVCRAVKSRSDIPVLLLVGTFEPFDEDEARSAGADAFLKKPFDSQDLLQQVEDLLAAAGADSGDETTGRATPAFEEATPAPAPAGEPVDESAETRPRAAVETAEAAAAPVAPPADETGAAPPAAPERESAQAAAEPSAEPPSEQEAAADAGGRASENGGALDEAAIDRIARRVVEMLGDTVLREVAWEVVPDLAEIVIKERIKELESQVE